MQYTLSIDIDNLVKFVFDALNGKVYADDSQIAVLSTAKLYMSQDPYTEIILRKLNSTTSTLISIWVGFAKIDLIRIKY